MKKRLCLVAALLLVCCAAASAEGADLADILAKGSVVMGFDSAYPPMTYTDADGVTYIGFDIDVATQVFANLGVELKFQPVNWDSKEEELDTARSIDCIWSGLTMTDALKERFAFTIPYMTNEQVLVVRPDSDIKTIADVAGKRLGTQAGSSSVTVLDDNPDFTAALDGGEPDLYDDFQIALQDLVNGNLDVVLVDSVVANAYIAKQDEADALVVLDEKMLAEEYGVAFRKEDAALADAVSAQLVALYEDGTLDALREKWGANDVSIVGDYADTVAK